MYALNLDKETGRILSATFPQYATKDMPIVEALPDGDISDFLFVNGEYIYEPLPEPEPDPEPEPTAEELLDILLGVTE